MTDAEFLQIAIKMTELRLNAEYQRAERLRQQIGAEAMATSDPKSEGHAAIRLLIGTWVRIAIFSESFSKKQLYKFFRCTPVWLVWLSLKPAIVAIHASGVVGQRYGKELETLALVYYEWSQSKEGAEFRSEVDQAVCANFA